MKTPFNHASLGRPRPGLLFSLLLALALLGVPDAVRAQAPGDLDPGFNANTDYTVEAVAVQPDGKVILGGRFFDRVDGSPRSGIARLNADGTLDAAFNPSADGPVLTVALQPDGKVILGGEFSNVNGIDHFGIARLNPDGSLDAGFNVSVSATQFYSVNALVILPDGKILVGGSFEQVNGAPHNGIARLLADGALDAGFNANVNDFGIRGLAVQPDGKLVFSGGFTQVNGVARFRIARLNADGTLDTGFNVSPDADGGVVSVVVQADGKIVLSGEFTQINGATRSNVARLNPDGSSATVTFTHSGELSQQIKVAYTLAGSPINGRDYAALSGLKKIKAGRASASVQIVSLPNGANGKVKLKVLPSDGYTVGSPAQVKVKITD